MTSQLKRAGDLEISQDLEFQERSWRVQRIGWVIMAILLVAALLGFFGVGPLSRATAGSEDDPLWIEYPRFSRLLKSTTINVFVNPEAVQNGRIRLWISRDYLKNVEISHFTPTEDSAEITGNGNFYTFQTSDNRQPVTIVIHLRAAKAGFLSGEMRLGGGPSQKFTQLVYP
jgi:hypothetical protein